MISNPETISLVAGGIVASGFAVYASFVGFRIVRRWDLKSASACQSSLERKTYLVSTILVCVLGFEIFSLFLFVNAAERIHPLFIGAMCAAGSLNANDYGYPTLVLKAVNVLACGAWLVIDHADHLAPDYPLVKTKCKFLIGITAFLLIETVFQINYFGNSQSNEIASCCGTLFSEDARSAAGGFAGMSAVFAASVFFASAAPVFLFGVCFSKTGRGVGLFSVFSTWFFVFSMAAAVSFVSVNHYELPARHCPFDLIQKEYYYIGFPLYASLFAAGALGLGIGIVHWLKKGLSIEKTAVESLKRICVAAMASHAFFIAISAFSILFSELKRLGY